MAGLDSRRLEAVFQARPDILQGIVKAADTPARVKLFNDIASHVHEQLGGSGSEPAHKKRKVDGPGAIAASGGGHGADVQGEQILLEVKDISVSIPQRKKFDLCFTSQHLYAMAAGAPVQGMIYRWADFEYSFYLPVPEKTQTQYNYVLMPKDSALLGLAKNPPPAVPDPLVFTVPAGAPKPGAISGSAASAAANFSDSFSTLFHWSLSANLPERARLVAANPDKFKSMLRQAHRPKEPAVHVKAFRGSKEGYLFFLDNGILWGFKKPLLFMPLTSIAAVSYCNILRTTFNMVVELFVPKADGDDGDKTEEVEFGMLDQADYPSIDEDYVKKNRLQDRSMAEQRKAKKELTENEKGCTTENAGDDEMVVDAQNGTASNGRTILEQAQWEEEQRLQDEEDEDEEDYDPGSEGESEGSGSSSDDDDEDEDEDGEEGEANGDD